MLTGNWGEHLDLPVAGRKVLTLRYVFANISTAKYFAPTADQCWGQLLLERIEAGFSGQGDVLFH